MGKTAKGFDMRDKSQSVRDIFPKCVKKKKRKKDLDNLRKQVVASKHAMVSSLKICDAFYLWIYYKNKIIHSNFAAEESHKN